MLKKVLVAATASVILMGAAQAYAFETFDFDPSHTAITWHVEHFGMSHPSGKFMSVKGAIQLDEKNPENSHVVLTIDTTALNSGVPALDKELAGENFFNVAKFPTARFESTKVERTGDKTAKVTGNLTLLAVTKPVVLDVTLNNIGENYEKQKTIGFSASTMIKRSDFGMGAFVPMVSDDVQLDIETEANIVEGMKK